jgi:ribonuclease HI
MRFLTGTTFGCNFRTLKTLYKTLIIATLNYGYEAYHTVSYSTDKQLQAIQTKALRLCLGALQSTPNIVVLAESNEMPLPLQRLQRLLLYSSKVLLKPGHVAYNITTNRLNDNICHNITNSTHEKIKPFLVQHNVIPPDKLKTTPPWLMEQPLCDISISNASKKLENSAVRKILCENLINQTVDNHIHLFTDASKSIDGSVGIAVYNPQKHTSVNLRLSNNISIYSAELVAIQLAISWLHLHASCNSCAIIFTDCLSALTSIKNHSSKSHPTLIHNILHSINHLYNNKNIKLKISYVSAHVGVTPNEIADTAANLARSRPIINYHFELDYGDYKTLISNYVYKLWQQQYKEHTATGGFYRKIRPTLDIKVPRYSNQRIKQVTGVRLRTGHNMLADSLFKRNLHNTGLCDCGEQETVQHILFNITCPKYKQHKTLFLHKIQTLDRQITLQDVLNNHDSLRLACDYVCKSFGHI